MQYLRTKNYLTLLAFAIVLCSQSRAFAQTQLAGISFETDVFNAAVNPSTNLVYVPSGFSFNAKLVVVDGNRNSPTFNNPVAQIALPFDSAPLEVAVNPINNRVYATDFFGGRLLIADGTGNAYIGAVAVGPQPRAVAVNPATNRVYVTVPESKIVVVIDETKNTIVGTIPIPSVNGFPYALAVNPLTNRIYVTVLFEESVRVIDGTNDSVIANIPLISRPESIAVNVNTNRIYVTNEFDGIVSVIQGTTNTIEANVDIGSSAEHLAVNPATGLVYATNSLNGFLTVIDGRVTSPTFNTILRSLSLATRMTDLVVNPTTGLIYVVTGLVMVFEDPGPPPAQRIAQLIEWVRSLNLAQGITNSLDSKLENAQAALESVHGGDASTACNKLDSFINHVEAQAEGHELTSIQAGELIVEANLIKSALGCE